MLTRIANKKFHMLQKDGRENNDHVYSYSFGKESSEISYTEESLTL